MGWEGGKASLGVEGIMGAPVRGSDDGRPSKTGPKREPPKDTPKDVGAAPSSGVTEVPDPPWKRKPRRELFEGDVAIVELRSRLALESERIPEPGVPLSRARAFAGVVRLRSGVALAAAVVGVAGYFWGFKLSKKMPKLTPPVASLKTSTRVFDPP